MLRWREYSEQADLAALLPCQGMFGQLPVELEDAVLVLLA